MYIHNDRCVSCEFKFNISHILDGNISSHSSKGIEKRNYMMICVYNFFVLFFKSFVYCIFQELALKPESKSFQMWKKPPFALYFDIYLYNWTNPTNLTEANYEKPILKQIGPYRFREVGVKTKVYWHSKNSSISYRKRNTYYFDAEGSVGRLDDKITTINVVALVWFICGINHIVF